MIERCVNCDKERTTIEVRARSEAGASTHADAVVCHIEPTRDAVLELEALLRTWPIRDDVSDLSGDEVMASLQFVHEGSGFYLEVVLVDDRA